MVEPRTAPRSCILCLFLVRTPPAHYVKAVWVEGEQLHCSPWTVGLAVGHEHAVGCASPPPATRRLRDGSAGPAVNPSVPDNFGASDRNRRRCRRRANGAQPRRRPIRRWSSLLQWRSGGGGGWRGVCGQSASSARVGRTPLLPPPAFRVAPAAAAPRLPPRCGSVFLGREEGPRRRPRVRARAPPLLARAVGAGVPYSHGHRGAASPPPPRARHSSLAATTGGRPLAGALVAGCGCCRLPPHEDLEPPSGGPAHPHPLPLCWSPCGCGGCGGAGGRRSAAVLSRLAAHAHVASCPPRASTCPRTPPHPVPLPTGCFCSAPRGCWERGRRAAPSRGPPVTHELFSWERGTDGCVPRCRERVCSRGSTRAWRTVRLSTLRLA